MCNKLVRIIKDDDGNLKEIKKWCLITNICGETATLCTSEFFGVGLSSAEFETKEVKRGGITCKDCLKIIKDIKKVRL